MQKRKTTAIGISEDEIRSSTGASAKPSLLIDLFRLMRPQQWTKNIYVFVPLIFAELWSVPAAQLAVVAALISFCFWSSSVYCFNDVFDVAADRRHPRKKTRPVAAGRVSVPTALALAAVLCLGGFGVAYALLPPFFLLVGALYLGNSLLYCVFVKNRVIADVLAIALGFVLRLEGGCVAIGADASSWIQVCGFSLALVLGFGKRRMEVANMDMETPAEYRRVLYRYNAELLNTLLGISISVCLLSYLLYTVASETVARHGTDKLVYTVPFVAYGLFRFVFKAQEANYDGPDEVLLKDRVFAINGVAWGAATILILYLT